MITTIIIVILNLLFFFVYPKKKKSYNNDYIKDKYIFIRKKVFKMLMFTNIINVIAYIIYLTIYLYDNDIELYGLIAIGVQLLTILPIASDIFSGDVSLSFKTLYPILSIILINSLFNPNTSIRYYNI